MEVAELLPLKVCVHLPLMCTFTFTDSHSKHRSVVISPPKILNHISHRYYLF